MRERKREREMREKREGRERREREGRACVRRASAHTLTHTVTRAQTLSHTVKLAHTINITHAHYHTHCHTHCHTITLYDNLSHNHTPSAAIAAVAGASSKGHEWRRRRRPSR